MDEPLCALANALSGRRATVMGLGRHGGGVATARFLAQCGARVTVTDLADDAALEGSLAALADVPIERFTLGRHCREDFVQTELLAVNPAVAPGSPWVALAQEHGVALVSETELFLRGCAAPVIAVTGTNGKSTTATMLAAVLRAEGRTAWLGGNIGQSLLGELGAIGAGHWVVLEVSSFQLYWLSSDAPAPQCAVVTNVTPNHLDWHGTWEHYRRAKQRLVAGPQAAGLVVLGDADGELADWTGLVEGRLCRRWDTCRLPALPLRGAHQRSNAACAAALAEAVGCGDESIAAGLKGFSGLPHRLEEIGTVDGRRFVNDSKATSPAAAMAALEAVEGPLWLLAGGHGKRADFAELGARIAARVRGAAFFGAAGSALLEQTIARRAALAAVALPTLGEAFQWSWERSQAGETILLSPACSSHDQFVDYAERGRALSELVEGLRSAVGR